MSEKKIDFLILWNCLGSPHLRGGPPPSNSPSAIRLSFLSLPVYIYSKGKRGEKPHLQKKTLFHLLRERKPFVEKKWFSFSFFHLQVTRNGRIVCRFFFFHYFYRQYECCQTFFLWLFWPMILDKAKHVLGSVCTCEYDTKSKISAIFGAMRYSPYWLSKQSKHADCTLQIWETRCM